jgi:hypothetical protein
MEPILCGGKGVFAQPPHSAHLWAPFVILSISFFLIYVQQYFSSITMLESPKIKALPAPV